MKKGRPLPVDLHVGRRVRLRRLEIGVSQQKLAEHLGVSFQQVQKYEKGTNRISASRLQQIAKFLDAPASYFFEGMPTDRQVGPNEDYPRLVAFLSSREGVALARSFLRVKSGKVRREMVELVESIAALRLAEPTRPLPENAPRLRLDPAPRSRTLRAGR
jgi:transcriptional regulator with XRE-family HTH domain